MAEIGAGVVDDADGQIVAIALQETADKRGLARADFAADDDKTGARLNGVIQHCNSLAMPLAEIKELGIRQQGKRRTGQAVESFIHQDMPSLSGIWNLFQPGYTAST